MKSAAAGDTSPAAALCGMLSGHTGSGSTNGNDGGPISSAVRPILITLFLLGLGIMVLGPFQEACAVARWSQIHGILGSGSSPSPLADPEVRRRFDSLYFEDHRLLALIPVPAGILVSVLAAAGLRIHVQSARKTENSLLLHARQIPKTENKLASEAANRSTGRYLGHKRLDQGGENGRRGQALLCGNRRPPLTPAGLRRWWCSWSGWWRGRLPPGRLRPRCWH